jgi:hypothetical protein
MRVAPPGLVLGCRCLGALTLVSATTLFSAGCGPSEPSAGVDAGAAGAAAALELTPIAYTPIEEPTLFLADGGPIELIFAPQGGHVFMVGARIRNSDSDTVKMTGRVRDPETGAVIAEDTRSVVLLPVPDEPGSYENHRATPTQMVHPRMCPIGAGFDIPGRPLLLEIEAIELYADFSEGSTSVLVTPTCMGSTQFLQEVCACECAASYTPGTCGGELG